MIYKIQEGDFVIYSGYEGYMQIQKALDEASNQFWYNYVISSINWNQNKKYFNDKKKA